MHRADFLKEYLKELCAIYQQGGAREESFYPALKRLVEAVAAATRRRHIHVTVSPASTDAGNPDFRVGRGEGRIIGYIEAKKPGQELDRVESLDQLQRYLAAFPNLILTNFLEFRLYRHGERIRTAQVARLDPRTKRIIANKGAQDDFPTLLDLFLDFSQPGISSAESLAEALAYRTRILRNVVTDRLAREIKEERGSLYGIFEAFRKYLIAELAPADFADMFSQTVTYGLFAARMRLRDRFSRQAAFDGIPRTIGILRSLFRYICFDDLPGEMAWCVDDIADVLASADVAGILEEYYRKGQGNDPVIHFYETFLAKYDPKERERRGVYYTPEPVVGYIVRSINEILKTEFGLPMGLGSKQVTLLDPAAGTMAFIARATQEAVREFTAVQGEGTLDKFVQDCILQNFYAFELLVAPYAIGHLKMSFVLQELGYTIKDNERVRFYLTNALDDKELETSNMPIISDMAEESHLAGEVKKKINILVILGNPPYSFSSMNAGQWIQTLIEDYKTLDGQEIKEKKIGVIQDDYVKFLRFAQWKIEQAGCGVVGMITNHSYLDSPTFRGMRRSLMLTFDDIYVLDLHGNSLKKETCPDGSPDRNVFDIRQGVAIAFFIKRGGKEKTDAVVHHADLYGSRENKYDWLNYHERKTTIWRKLQPSPPFYLFTPLDETGLESYKTYPSVKEIFPTNGVGVITRKDSLTIRWSRDDCWELVQRFLQLPPDLARSEFQLGKDTYNWEVKRAQDDLRNSGPTCEKVVPILYRPFDTRFTYYTGKSFGYHSRPCYKVMRHMLAGENLALLVSRQVASGFRHAFVSDLITNFNNIDVAGRFGSGYHFPLYLYPTAGKQDLFTQHNPSDRTPNLNSKLVETLTQAYGQEPTPEEIFHYIYAVLYAHAYRTKYADFLKSDFPRVPFTADAELFRRVAGLGERLVGLHLLKSPELSPPACRFEGKGEGLVGRGRKEGLRYDPAEKRVYINASQYFEPVPEEVWSYQIGGYQVCEKWLKDRVERELTLDEILTYLRIVTAIGRTLVLQKEIDALYPQVEETIVPVLP